jgi:hypothetical protein
MACAVQILQCNDKVIAGCQGERIKLHLVPLDQLWQSSPDGKSLSALTLYHELKKAGKLSIVSGALHRALMERERLVSIR